MLDTGNITKSWNEWVQNAREYSIDAAQRTIIFWDILRKRGNIYIDHIKSGQPPVLTFNYEIILDGRQFKRPVNFSLVRISDRRKKSESVPDAVNRRQSQEKNPPPLPKRPLVIIDPRAGHGPGIGGSKRDSEIGMALEDGYSVYFILFHTDPMPGQTLADVEAAEVRFIEKVNELHPHADSPAIIGNCQAGWSAALLCADRPDITGPLVLNGAPLSYWAGIGGTNPMRYTGGLVGGVWMNSLLSDLGHGKFDGANLVSNFESLNPANTLWSKQYGLYSQVDTEEERYLKFEKWWGGFFMMTTEEIHFIVSNLFVGNKLEAGGLELRRGEKVNLKNIENPILVFASRGDNITPPQQALNWIPRVYRSLEEIKRLGQVIIYIIHENIGHLGIFVSAGVAKKEHSEIISNLDMIDCLPPGLYEMVIEGDVKKGNFTASFEERTLEDITAMDDGVEDEGEFHVVAAVSDMNDSLYRLYVRPWVQLCTTELSAEVSRALHPLRMQRYALSDMNPFLGPLKWLNSVVRENRKVVSPNNPLVALERQFSSCVEDMLNHYRDSRDHLREQMFRAMYGNDLVRYFFTPAETDKPSADVADPAQEIVNRRMQAVEEGDIATGLIRVLMAATRTTHTVCRRHYDIIVGIGQTHKILSKLRPAVFRRIIREQNRLLEADEDRAIKALAKLIPKRDDRLDAIGMARRIALADGAYDSEEKDVIERIKKALPT